MNRLIKRLYILLAVLLLSILIGNQLQLTKSERFIKEEVEKELFLSTVMMHEEVNEWIDQTNIIIQEVSRSISYGAFGRDSLETYLVSVGKNYPELLGIYYGPLEGDFLISNGWDVPESFDHTVRPWFIDALQAKSNIVTDPFEDAMTGDLIVTFAKPVWNQNGDIIGVVGGDITLKTLTDKFDAYSHMSSSEFLLVDKYLSDESSVLASSGDVIPLEAFDNWFEEFNVLDSTEHGMHETSIDHLDGYFHFHRISGTDWILMNFSQTDDFTETINDIERLSIYVYVILLIFMIAIYYVQKKYITQPLSHFGDHMSRINILQDPGYRLPQKEHALFGPVVKKINRVLERVEEYVTEIENDKNEMHAMNEELEASLEQIIATEQEASRQKLNFEALFINNQSAVAMMDQDHKIRNINEAFTKLFGYTLEEIEGVNLDDVISNHEARQQAGEYTSRMFSGQIINVEGVRYGKNDTPLEVRIQGVPMTHHGYMVGAFGIYTDIGSFKAEERYRHYLSTHDDLTGLYSRTHFNQQLFEEQQMGTYPLSIIIVDVNGLKLINDAFGPSVGDELLIETAKALSVLSEERCADNCLLARYGGDEFIILVKNKTKEETAIIAKEIKRVCRQIKLMDVEVSVSVGWSRKKSSEEDVVSILRNAEDDLYKHKIMESSSVKGKTIYTIVNTLHETNKREEEHSKRVSMLSEKFGEALNLSDREMTALRSMSLLHDVGKIAIDENILNKPSGLTDAEYSEMKRHPEIGYRILSSVAEMSEIAEYVLAHHERWDGKGYPRGLKEEEIPFLARVITIVDAYDAMTSNRPYRAAQDIEWALDELSKNAGSQFDPELVPIFIKVLDNKRE